MIVPTRVIQFIKSEDSAKLPNSRPPKRDTKDSNTFI